jgi:cellulose synthase/poly-beta-1,6-N-acetylglucosamine synthase-like glycosyltransferase
VRLWALRGLIVAGLAATGYYFSWWGGGDRIAVPVLAVTLVMAGAYSWAQLLSSWFLYLAARRRPDPAPIPPSAYPTLDVFVTSCGEPYPMIERALRAAVAMRGEHRTWLLDDGSEPRLARLAARLGAGYLTRSGRADAKAGNVNAAVARTDGELIAIFDVDHVPEPEFLQRTTAHFRDPTVGFVQVMLSFRNERESWFARAAGETCVDFFNPTSMGMDRLGSATLMGSNAVIRREALISAGGYRAGLAEDLATSVALHAAGWKSVYVAEPLAPGMAPRDARGWYTQQLKWSRGVFEVLVSDFPRVLRRLSWKQRLCYAVRMTYYWAGPVAAIHMAFTVAVLLGGPAIAQVDLQSYVVHLVPLVVVALAIRLMALICWRHPSVRVAPLWRAVALVFATWPVYTLAWIMAVLRLPLGFRETPKLRARSTPWAWLVPQLVACCGLLAAIPYGLTAQQSSHAGILATFCGLQCAPQLVVLWQAIQRAPAREQVESPAEA